MTRVPKSIKSTRQILRGTNHILQTLYAQSRDILAIEAVVREILADDVSVASLKDHELTLTSPSSAVASKLRYRQRNIITALKRTGIDVNSIKIKVLPSYQPFVEEQRERTLSGRNAEHLEESAQYIEDEALRKALIKLAKRGKPAGQA